MGSWWKKKRNSKEVMRRTPFTHFPNFPKRNKRYKKIQKMRG